MKLRVPSLVGFRYRYEMISKRSRIEFGALVTRLRHPPYPASGNVFLHLGCGEIVHPDFINVDLRYYPHIHHLSGVEQLPFQDAFADLIYASHCLEHISYRDTSTVLLEWHRVLKPGGIVRLSVPDFDTIVRMYLDNDRDLRGILGPLFGGQEYKENTHYAAFTFATLSECLTTAGFKNVRTWKHGQDPLCSFPDWSGRTLSLNGQDYAISLNVEAEK